MTTYNVHLYREIQLIFEGVEADSAQGALQIARAGTIDDADDLTDSGEDLHARVEIEGDANPAHASIVDFEPERHAAPKLLAALESLADQADEDCPEEHRSRHFKDALQEARAAVAEATAGSIDRQTSDPANTLRIIRAAAEEYDEMGRDFPMHHLLDIFSVGDATGKTQPPASDARKKPYSVLLLYPDYANDGGKETYYAWVLATDPIAAIAEAQREALALNQWDDTDPNAFAPLLVTAGHHYGQPVSDQ